MPSVDDHIYKAIAFLNENRIDEAIQEYGNALKIDPADSTALTGLGQALDELGDFAEAIKSYKKALRSNPRHVIAHSGLGVVYEKQRKTDLAIKEYVIALEIDRDTAFMHIVYARDRHTAFLREEKRQYENKLKKLEKSIESYISSIKVIDDDISDYFPTTVE
jgi:tetratricopeptide (TPR) repeat protein